MTKNFINFDDLSLIELQGIIDRAITLKEEHKSGKINDSLKNKTLAMIFDKSSTRTRVSFEAGMTQLGGQSLFLSEKDIQLGRGCLLYTSPSPRDQRGARMPSSA